PLVGLGIMAAVVQRGRASLDRIMDLWMKSEDVVEVSPQRPQPFQRMEIRHLNFRFADEVRDALRDVSLVLEPGRSIGLAGDTGAGKSVLAKLACGVLEAPKGAIWINGADFADIQFQESHGAWRHWFAYAPQDGFLFSWTIADNISMHPSTPPEEVWNDAEKAGLGPDIPTFPQGLSSVLGEKGVNLSGGQRQRVGLARAFRALAPIMVLDDVLSAVDPKTERRVVESLLRLRESHALLIVSHRYASLEQCDEILFLRDGRVLERGTHAQLLEQNGAYAHNWKLQQVGKKS
ncbi:MAG TPA: ABC transporter ATP-binding protein, partial [Fibrobacteraceae bacterium]|nr:ABC transporter ATP-binding protein [Fibrobacteraceae bacterium]